MMDSTEKNHESKEVHDETGGSDRVVMDQTMNEPNAKTVGSDDEVMYIGRKI